MRARDLPESEVRARFDAALAEAGGVRPLARRAKLSPTYVCLVARGRLPISGRLAAFLGVVRVTVYREADHE